MTTENAEAAEPQPAPGADAIPAEPEAAAVEADAEAVAAAAEEESEAESPPTDEEDVEKKTDPGDSFQDRIDTLTKRFKDAERALTGMERENESLRQRIADTPISEEPVKTLADFAYNESEYRTYLFKEMEGRAIAAAERVAAGFQSQARSDTAIEEHGARETEFSKSVADYHKVAYHDDLKITNDMAAEIRASDIGPEIAYYLGKHPAEASLISRMTMRDTILEIATLERQILAEKAKVNKVKKVSDAPPPPAKIKGAEPGLTVSTTDPKSDKMSDEAWFRAEDRRQAKLRGK